MFLRTIGSYKNHMVSHPRRRHSSAWQLFHCLLFGGGGGGKSISVAGSAGAWSCEILRLPCFLDSSYVVVRLSALCAGFSLPQGRFLFLNQPQGSWKDSINWKFVWPHWELNPLPSGLVQMLKKCEFLLSYLSGWRNWITGFSHSLQRGSSNRHKKTSVSVLDSQSGNGQKFLKRKMSDPDIHHSLSNVGSPTGTSAPRSAAISIPQHRSSDVSPQQSLSAGCEYPWNFFHLHAVMYKFKNQI
jgi:hypothetical protein